MTNWYIQLALGNIRKITFAAGRAFMPTQENFIWKLPSAQSFSRNKNFVSASKNLRNFSCSALFHMKTRVCLKYFVKIVACFDGNCFLNSHIYMIIFTINPLLRVAFNLVPLFSMKFILGLWNKIMKLLHILLSNIPILFVTINNIFSFKTITVLLLSLD